MIAFLIDVVVGFLVPGFGGRRRARAEARAFAEGGEVLFEACILGDRPFCSPAVVFITASRNSLYISPTEVKTLARRALPAEHIEVRQIRKRARHDSQIIPPFWSIAECHDGNLDFVVACAPQHMRWFTGSLRTGRPD